MSVPVPIIESIELEADGRATIWIKTPHPSATLYEPLDYHYTNPTNLQPTPAVPGGDAGILKAAANTPHP